MIINELISSLQTRILNVGYRSHTSEWVYDGVISPFSRMYFVTAGEAYVSHHGREYNLTPGSIHLVPCFTLSNYRCPEYFQMYYIHFTTRLEGGMDLCNLGNYTYQIEAHARDESLFKQLVELLPGKTIEVCSPHSREDKREFMKKLDETDSSMTADVYLESDGVLRQILSGFLRTMEGEQTLLAAGYSTVIEYIEEHIDEVIPLKILANMTRQHTNYFSEQFMKVYGVRPGEYILRRRVERAQGLIVQNLYSLKEVAAMTGFNDAAHFSRTFKRYTGGTPSKYFETMGI